MESSQSNSGGRARGRPRSFDRDAVLDRAMRLFWEHGYEATSLAALTSVMGINAPSLYAAFGDKQALFLEAVDRYLNRAGADADTLMAGAPTAREAMTHFLEASATRLTDPKFPRGCMVVLSAVSCSEEATPVQARLAEIRATWSKELEQRIARGIAEGDVPPQTSAAGLSAFYMVVVQGMSLAARDGAGRKRLLEIAATAMQAWPVMPAAKKRKRQSP